jgi:hypothetical protein
LGLRREIEESPSFVYRVPKFEEVTNWVPNVKRPSNWVPNFPNFSQNSHQNISWKYICWSIYRFQFIFFS